MLLIQWLHNPWLFLSSDNSEPLDNGNPWFNLSFSPFPFHFPSILQRLLYLASYSTLSSCVSFGSVSTPDFSVMWSWTPSRSQMCFLFMLKHLGLNAVLSRQRGKFAKKKKKIQLPANWWAVPSWRTRETLQRSWRWDRSKGHEWGWQSRRSQKLTLSHAWLLDESSHTGRRGFDSFQSTMVLLQNPKKAFSSISELEAGWPGESKWLSPLSDGAVSIRDDSTGLGVRVLVLVSTLSCFFSWP